MATIAWYYTVQEGEVIESTEVETEEKTREEVEAEIAALREEKYAG